MPLLAVGLVLVSCVLHATWNLLLKQARDKLAFTALYLTAAVALYLPLFLWSLPGTHIPPLGWLCIAGTGVVYFGYFLGLARAYRDGDLSIAYPLMRGLGPALTLVGGVLLLSERPTAYGVAGILLILLSAFGLHREPAQGSAPASPRALVTPATLAALFVGLMYGLYSLIDKVSMSRLHVSPPVYIYLTYSTAAALIVPCVLHRRGAAAVLAEWRLNARACVAVGALSILAYLLVLYALSLPGAPVSYIVPLRTTSVLIGVLLGTRLLREGRLRARLAMSLVMMAGITLIAWKG